MSLKKKKTKSHIRKHHHRLYNNHYETIANFNIHIFLIIIK